MVAYMDKLVGRLIAKLDELGIRDNTLLIFLGDNGTAHGVTSQFKGQAYEGGKGSTTARGMHVPLIANWPGRVPAGRVNSDLVDSTDFLPTMCEAAGVKVPSSLAIDGRSFLPQLMGEKGNPREWIYSWFSMQGGPTRKEFAMTATTKLYRNGRVFDLQADPFEENPLRMRDLSGAEAEAAQKLQAVLDQYADARPAELLAGSAKKPKKDRSSKPGRKKRRAARQRGE
jgi:arylsulfatase A